MTTAATEKTSCPECGQSLETGTALSLILEIHQSPDFTTSGRHYRANVYHRHCQAPDLILRVAPLPGHPELTPGTSTAAAAGNGPALAKAHGPAISLALIRPL